jgi:retinol dehydrogenase 12
VSTTDEKQDLTGRTVLVTGANTGIGFVTARELARAGARVLIACRSQQLADSAAAQIQQQTGAQVSYLPLDLGDFESVRRCAQAFLASDLPLHVLVNNAGLAGKRGLTPSGFEVTFGTNYMGHFLLTQLLLPRLLQSGPARVVTLTSEAHYRASGIDWQAVRESTRSRTGVPEYNVSKLANVLFSAELARRVAGQNLTTYAVHPGVVASDVWRNVPRPLRWLMTAFMKSPEQGAENSIFCAGSSVVQSQTGLYYHGNEPREPSPPAQDGELARELWQRSEHWLS